MAEAQKISLYSIAGQLCCHFLINLPQSFCCNSNSQLVPSLVTPRVYLLDRSWWDWRSQEHEWWCYTELPQFPQVQAIPHPERRTACSRLSRLCYMCSHLLLGLQTRIRLHKVLYSCGCSPVRMSKWRVNFLDLGRWEGEDLCWQKSKWW
jgi:hypothetical protein